MDFIGEFAAIGTAFSFAITSTLFTMSAREVGSPLINRSRLLMAVGFTILLHWILEGKPLPIDAEPSRWQWLGLSGLVGLVAGDASLFQAFVLIGHRLSMLMMAFAPVLSVILAQIFLSETLTILQLVGVTLTISGIALVITEKGDLRLSIAPRIYVVGILFGFGGALGQAGGLILSKKGLSNGFPALSGNLIRLLVATTLIWGFAALQGQAKSSFQRLRQNPSATRSMMGGAFAGPFIGVWLSLIAVQKASVGIASTLMALTPIFLIPIGYVFFDEHITSRAIIGTIIAVAGTALLFL